MKTLKTYIETEYKTIYILFLLSASSLILLMARVKLTQSFHFLFLVWNLFLAGIPYLISTFLFINKKINIIILLFVTAIWLLFLPNAPYIITDLFHLKHSSWNIIWLDTLVITAFSITGMLFFLKSVLSMEKTYKKYFNNNTINYALPVLFMAVSFGIYLGRYLRFNSWEIINKPNLLFKSILNIIIQPNTNIKAWLFTLTFSMFLYIMYIAFKKIKIE